MKITYVNRKRRPGFHSIERVFDRVKAGLGDVPYESVDMPCESNSIGNIIRNIRAARAAQGKINHITGDILYVTPFMKGKKVITIHDMGSALRGSSIKQRLIKWWWFDRPCRAADLITVVSEFSRKELIRAVNVEPDKVKVVANPIPGGLEFTPLPIGSKPRILHIGTKPNKNLERLISALKNIACHLTVVGHLQASQKEALEREGLEYSNQYDLNDDEMADLFRSCHLLCFVSTYEGFGMPVIEANAIGRPVITSNVSSLPEVAGDAAILVDPHSEVAIEEAVKELIGNEDLRNSLIEKGVENAKRFNLKEVATSYLDIYKTVADHA